MSERICGCVRILVIRGMLTWDIIMIDAATRFVDTAT